MASIWGDTGNPSERIVQGWHMLVTAPAACALPSAADAVPDWRPALVPGTAAQVLGDDVPFHERDVWYRVTLAEAGPQVLRFEGLATLADLYVDGDLRLQTTSMFQAYELPITGPAVLHIAFRSLKARMAAQKLSRARWRVRMIPDQALRGVRTTLLGHMPGWAPLTAHVGPYRPVTRQAASPERQVMLLARWQEGKGVLTCLLPEGDLTGDVVLHCAGQSLTLTRRGGRLMGRLSLPDVAPWWPHTHGTPHLHAVTLTAGERQLDLGKVGFRSISLDPGPDGRGFGLLVNGVPVFARGASWTPPDPLSLQPGEAIERSLDQAVAAHVNMLRISGVTLYESDEFYRACDARGIMVWQDFAFANFDYPLADSAFLALVQEEARQFLDRTQASPSLVVFCGGSEMAQQASMLGLPAKAWTTPLIDTILPDLVREWRPDAVYAVNSPSGGILPFSTDEGVTHYYGVGAYCRPLSDARRASVRFAAECLAFANVPCAQTLHDNGMGRSGQDGRWKAGVPRDIGASWDFEDVREHYLRELYGVDPARLRYEDAGRWLDMSRAVVAEVMEETFGEWRRPGSVTRGALVWLWQDMKEGAGWGVIDDRGRPKSAWHALRRAFRPIQILLSDEGLNGLMLHGLNETAEPVEAVLSLACLRDGALPVVSGEQAVTLPPRGSVSLSATDLSGLFSTALLPIALARQPMMSVSPG